MVLGTQQLGAYIWLAFLGAGGATVVVYGVASFGREGATPVKLALAGAAVTAGLTSVTSAIVMTDVDALNELRFWQVGSLAGRYMPVFWQTAPFIVVGTVVALGAGRALNGLALGEDVARALGQRVRLTRVVLFVTVAVLCGAATAACGPIVFVGLVVPHLARLICGPDYRWILPYSLVLDPDRPAARRHRRPARARPRRAPGRRRPRRPRRTGVRRPRPLPQPDASCDVEHALERPLPSAGARGRRPSGRHGAGARSS